MTSDRAVRVWTTVAVRAQQDVSPISPRHACLACVDALEVGGAALVLTSNMAVLEPVCTTDRRAGEVEELQARVGEGPGIDALETGRPILVENLAAATSRRRWPVFSAGAVQLGVNAMFSLPLALGAIQVGALNLFSDAPVNSGMISWSKP